MREQGFSRSVKRRPPLVVVAALVGLVAVACQPAGGGPPRGGPQPESAPRAQKTIVVAAGRQHTSEARFGSGVTDAELSFLLTAGLYRQNQVTADNEPWMAEELPAPANGTWVVNPDGTMVTRYRLRPNIKWHDGTPLSSRDFILGWEMVRDAKWGHENRQVAIIIDRIETPDDRTLILHWKQPYNRAHAIPRFRLEPLPRHILEEVFLSGDVDRMQNLPHWTAQYVGTGPFRVVRWEQDQAIEMDAFSDYFLGRPKVDRIIWRFIPDTNTVLANVLSNNVDVVLRQAYTIDTALTAKEQWEAKGEGQVILTPITLNWVDLSAFNPWFADIRVRRALLHAIDRQEVVDTLSKGLEIVAHVPLNPRRPQYDRALTTAAKYEYSPARARQLLGEAGWTPGADGVLVNGRGERFVIDARTRTEREAEQLQAATVDYWRRVGVESQINNMTDRVMNSDELRGRHPGAKWNSASQAVESWINWFGNLNIPTEQNRWVGNNESRWDDPAKEAALQELDQTLDPRRRGDLIVEFTRLYAEQLPVLPLKYLSEVMSVRKGVVNVHPRLELGGEWARTWNGEQWDRL